MSIPEEFKELTPEQCHKPFKGDVAWLRMVLQHLDQGLISLRNKNVSELDRIDNALCPLTNAQVYIENAIWRSLEEKQ